MRRHFPKEVIALHGLLRDTWAEKDPRSNVALYPASYSETFLDMSRAVYDAGYRPVPGAGTTMPYEEPVGFTERGFAIYGDMLSTITPAQANLNIDSDKIRLSESSHADEHYAWLNLESPEGVGVIALIDKDKARELRRALDAFIDHHPARFDGA